MKVTTTYSSIIKPCEPTPNTKIPLAEWDQIGYISHIPTIHIYKPSPNFPQNTQIENLKDSLSKILVPFYPLAGRLHWTTRGRLEIGCDATGVEFIVSETGSRLEELGEFSTCQEIHKLSPNIDYKNTPFEEIPLMFVQITIFQCGSITVCPALSHAVIDGRGASYFLNEWAKVARGEQLDVEPLHDRTVMKAGEPPSSNPTPLDFNPLLPPPLLIGETNDKEERKKETIVAMLKLTKNQVEILKNRANEEKIDGKSRPFSRYETITGHVWKCASKARGHKPEQETGLGISVDIRRRMKPQIADNYFGKATIDVVAEGCSGELVSRTLSYACSRVREAIDKVTNEHINMTIDFWKNQEDLKMFQDLEALKGEEEGPFYGNPNLGVTSWLTLAFHGLDFGWGNEVYMGPITHDFDGDFILFPDHDEDGGLILRACLQTPHMEVFKKVFYEDI
ncbi:acetyltransferase [Lithospermum erythrorhizon]|uniref:Acetyltransferase n=1 Tax=Lithospermum erythrorhizon TaxID=34254 RepID=A0AAV3QE65_LITER